ncbi:MAG: DinB family protein [Aureliella sp.]
MINRTRFNESYFKMDAIASIKGSIELAEMVGMSYLNDLSDEDLMKRPHADCNHINWQVGHLIASENSMMSSLSDSIPALPEGFADKYTKETASSDSAADFATKDELMAAYKSQRAATMEFLSSCSAEDLDKPTGVEFAPTCGSMLAMQGAHWLMHCGQWVIIRRESGKPIVI